MKSKLFIEDFSHLDCAVLDPELGLLGASWIVDLVLEGSLDHQSMVMDFALVKKEIKSIIDNYCDHSLIVPRDIPGLELFEEDGLSGVKLIGEKFEVIHLSPNHAITLVPGDMVDPSFLAVLVGNEVLKKIKDRGISAVEISLREEEGEFFFRYCHGLKKHDGNCQRIAHGHRSKLKIWENNKVNLDLEELWCEKLDKTYIASKEDIQTQDNERIHFFYKSSQGNFKLSLKQSSCYLMEGDTTIECIAFHLASELKKAKPSSSFRVKVYEGIGKGSLAEV